MLKTKTWILIFAAVLILALASVLLIHFLVPGSSRVEVIQDGVCIREIDLSQVTEPYSFVVEAGDGGTNTIEVEPGRIRISEADCPDQVCVRRGWFTGGPSPVVCLPHHLVIQAAEASDLDAVSR